MSQLKIISLDNLKYVMNYLKTKFTAPMATGDELGNNIRETYQRKDEKIANAHHADHSDTADKATNATYTQNATNDALGREISKTYVSAAGGKVDGELHVQQPAADDRSDKPATTQWTADLLAHTLPSKKEDGSLQSWDINVTGNAQTATEAAHTKEADHSKSADTAVSANAVAWTNVSGKPGTYTPAPHDHDAVYVKKDEASKAVRFTNGTCIESTGDTVMIGMQPMNGDKAKAAMWLEKDDTTEPVMGKPRAVGGIMTWNDGIRSCDSRLDLGEYPAQPKTNSIALCDKEGSPFMFMQGTAHPDRYVATMQVFNDKPRKNGAYLNLHMCQNGVRLLDTNAVIQGAAMNVPTSDNGWGNFWIT